MKRALSGLFCAGLIALAGLIPHLLSARSSVDPGQVAISVARWLEQGHYTREKLDDKMSGRFLADLSYNAGLQQAVLSHSRTSTNSRTSIPLRSATVSCGGSWAGARDLRPFQAARGRPCRQEQKARSEKYAFDSNRTVEINRQDAPWPKNQEEADRIWQNRIEAELLKEELAELKLRPPQETVTRRYDQVLRNVREMEDDDVVKTFLSALAQTYDPHSGVSLARPIWKISRSR